jgi:hypothetical protein
MAFGPQFFRLAFQYPPAFDARWVLWSCPRPPALTGAGGPCRQREAAGRPDGMFEIGAAATRATGPPKLLAPARTRSAAS